MEVKKTSHSNLENKRFIFREIGFIVALAMVFFAFETKYYQEEAKEITFPIETSDIEEVLPVFVPQRASQPLPKISVNRWISSKSWKMRWIWKMRWTLLMTTRTRKVL